MKKILASKAFWLNVITVLTLICTLPEFGAVIPSLAVPYIALANAVLNIIVRVFFTSQPLTEFAAGQSGE